MIPLPKPKFAETNVPIGKSIEDYRNEIINMQTHVLNDAIDRVSFRGIQSTEPQWNLAKSFRRKRLSRGLICICFDNLTNSNHL